MIDIYHYIVGAMIFFIALSYVKYGCVSALSLLVLVSFLSYYAIHFLPLFNIESAVIDSIRVALIMVACMHYGARSVKPIQYLCYSLVLFGFIFVNGLFLINPALAPNELYIAITFLEVLMFMYGMCAVYNAKTQNDSILNSNTNSFRYSCKRGLNSGDHTSAEGA